MSNQKDWQNNGQKEKVQKDEQWSAKHNTTNICLININGIYFVPLRQLMVKIHLSSSQDRLNSIIGSGQSSALVPYLHNHSHE